MSTTERASIERIGRDLRRVERLSAALFRPLRRAVFLDLVVLAVTAVASLGLAATSGSVPAAAVVAGAGSIVAYAVAWWWLYLRPDRQAAYEVLTDHATREGAMWVAETGTSLPPSFSAAKRWLDIHHDGPGRANMLTRVGRLPEARAALASMTDATPEDALNRRIFDRQLDLFEGKPVDTADLLEMWRTIQPSPLRDLRRWCIAILDAQAAVDAGRDPWTPLAAARPDVESLDERVNGGRFLRNVAALHALVALTVTFIAAFVAG